LKALSKIKDEKENNSLTPKNNNSLPKKQESALAALLACPTMKEAAFASGVSEVTLWRYMQDEKFLLRYRKARRDVVEHAVMRLQHDAGEAAKVLSAIAKDTQASASSRVAAARTIIDQAMRAVEMGELQGRIEQLETRIKKILEERVLDAAMKEDEEQ